MGICAYCNEDRKLCDSHAIPNGFFRAISKPSEGKLVAVPGGQGLVHLSQDAGKAKLLCQDCEAHFNRHFDAPIVNALKSWDRAFQANGFSTRFSFSADQLAQSVASICWRASLTESLLYKNAKVNGRDRSWLRKLIDEDVLRSLKNSSCAIYRIKDSTAPESGGFSQETVSQIILPVNAYKLRLKSAGPLSHVAFTLVVQGFLIQLFLPRLPHSKRSKSAFLRAGANRLRATPQEFTKYPPLMAAMISAYAKQVEGKTKLTDRSV